jgi:hypothetical protein
MRFSPRLHPFARIPPQKTFLALRGTTLETQLTHGYYLEPPLRPSRRIRSLYLIESVLQAPVFEPSLDPKKYVLLR